MESKIVGGLVPLLSAALILCVPVYAQETGTVTISLVDGSQLIGLNTTTVRGVPYYSFRGIPYAEPPVGQLRYKDPVPHTWSGSLEALEDAPMCTQSSGGQEDCLYLNVYTRELPQVDSSAGGGAVMVYLHGGSLVSGSGSSTRFGPDFFLEVEGVILVTLNYRLGALGFLSTEDLVISGNYGFKDQRLALQWVRDNIVEFGGDPSRVTLFGQSAGSISTSFHLLSASTAGLYQRAILESGTALGPRGVTDHARDTAFRLGRSLGFSNTSDSTQELAEFLMAADAEDLISVDERWLSDEDRERFGTFGFLPVVEQPYEGAFLTDTPSNILLQQAANRVPIIAGDTTAECLAIVYDQGIFASNESMAEYDAGLVETLSLDIRVGDEEYRTEAAQRMRSFYLGDEPLNEDDFYPLVALLSDLNYIEPVDMFVRTWANQSTAVPIYEYQFAYKGNNSALPELQGVTHGGELLLLFYSSTSSHNLDRTSDEDIARTMMVTMWTNFAKTANPTPTPVGETLWQPYGGDGERNYLLIDSQLSAQQNVYGDRLDFMHSLLPLQL